MFYISCLTTFCEKDLQPKFMQFCLHIMLVLSGKIEVLTRSKNLHNYRISKQNTWKKGTT